MWRVHFDERKGVFVLQVLRLGIFWRTVMKAEDKPSQLTFGKYDEAVNHSEQIGLNKLYRDRSRNRFLEAVSAA